MEKPSVWPAMALAFERAKGDLAERLVQALEAAEREGGDIRGRQSAAIVIVASDRVPGRPWTDRVVDLRVEDHTAPLVELRRLVTLSRVYRRMNEGDEWTTRGDMAKAVTAYNQAIGLLPDSATNGEAVFWTGVGLVTAGGSGRVCHTSRAPSPCIPRGPTWCRGSRPPACCRRDKALGRPSRSGDATGAATPRGVTSTVRR